MSDGEPHLVRVSRNGMATEVVVDGQVKIFPIRGSETELTLQGPLIIGGLRGDMLPYDGSVC